ncbi:MULTISPECIES: hypothetical protein [Bacillus cereus group]|uniref:Uncharacterized protein n=1 Tax=Bacillus cereus TaxID=1396 RepID=A0AAW7NJ00_BACCE|nr:MULTISPECIES: hypothetical protein [Bacillus cereus group]MBY0131309.1 hypothetical protein [Bacillus cereus]MDN4874244.1 hypothetical protein [Bacillus cereus]MEB8637989.1 hypothetical protein [Bacillus cereus]MEB8746151.1 hypothetical protein [Bacillus cereus]MEB8799123.1 hypothetical protein [Bacillus cereus]
MGKKKSGLYIGEETYGGRKIEDVFKEVYEHYFNVKVTVTRKKKTEVKAS